MLLDNMAKIAFDKYYTPPTVARLCINKTYEIIGKDNITEIIEPSAGCGMFSHQRIGYTIFNDKRKHEYIEQADFIKLDLGGYKKGRLFIGNPPFGGSSGKKQGHAPLSHLTTITAAGGETFSQKVAEVTRLEALFTKLSPQIKRIIRGSLQSNGGWMPFVEAFTTMSSKDRDGVALGFSLSHDFAEKGRPSRDEGGDGQEYVVVTLRSNGKSQEEAEQFAQLFPDIFHRVYEDQMRAANNDRYLQLV